MSTTVTTEFRFDDMPLRVERDGYAARLFGRADIVIDRRTWRIGTIETFSPSGAPILVYPHEEEHEELRLALSQQFGDEIDEQAADVVERRGGYMVLFGVRMPSNPAYRGLPPYRPSLSHVPHPARTVHL